MDQIVGLYGHGNGIVSFRFKDQIKHHYIPKEYMKDTSPVECFYKWMRNEYNAICIEEDGHYIRINFENDEDLVLFLLKYR